MPHPPSASAYFEGVFTALVTPFQGGEVDEAAVVRLVERQIAAGVAGLVPGGTTGETATLKHDEKLRLTELCISTAAGRVPVIAGCGSNDTAEAIELARHAKRVGADGALVVTPYYNRPSQEGLYAHYAALNEAVELPVLIYNVPGRTGVDISTDTVARLSKLPNIIGVKDATGEVARATWMRKTCAQGFVLLSGDDPSALGYVAHGGHGLISVTSNVAPDACARVVAAALAGDFTAARAGQDRLIPLHRALFADASPGPAKFALYELGLCAEELRLPLVACGEAVRSQVRAAMAEAGVTS